MLDRGSAQRVREMIIDEIEEQLERYKNDFTGSNELKGKQKNDNVLA